MEIILAGIIVALLAFIYLKDKQNASERRSLINGILSKDSAEFAHAEAIVEDIKERRPETTPDFIDQSTLSDDDFFDAVKSTNE